MPGQSPAENMRKTPTEGFPSLLLCYGDVGFSMLNLISVFAVSIRESGETLCIQFSRMTCTSKARFSPADQTTDKIVSVGRSRTLTAASALSFTIVEAPTRCLSHKFHVVSENPAPGDHAVGVGTGMYSLGAPRQMEFGLWVINNPTMRIGGTAGDQPEQVHSRSARFPSGVAVTFVIAYRLRAP